MKAKKILSIPRDRPELLFENNIDGIKKLYRSLVVQWHPDTCVEPLANEVFIRVNQLYKKALDKVNSDSWNVKDSLSFTDKLTGKQFKFRFRYDYEFELGHTYICNNYIFYFIKQEYRSLFDNGVSKIKNLRYSSDKMKRSLSPYLPEVYKTFKADHLIVTVKKSPDYIPLDLLLEYVKGSMSPKHACWMISSVYNLACYLQYIDLVHNDLALKNCFVSVKDHSLALLGGWWYATEVGTKLSSVPKSTYDLLPMSVRSSKIADYIIDNQLVKAFGRELLGDKVGMSLRKKDIPSSIVDWCLMPGTNDTAKAYHSWMHTILPDAYGKRKFIKWDINIDDVYNSHI